MRGIRTTVALAACAIAGIGASTAQASGGKVLICHGTASDTNPYVLVSVSENASAAHVDGHGQNNYPDFLLPADSADCSGGLVPEVAGE